MELLKPLIGWIHTLAAALSLLFGTIVILNKKGDAKHRKLGRWYFYVMLINNLTALMIVNAFGKWFFPHYLALLCLAVLIPGIIAVKRKHKHWLKVHLLTMVISYYLLIGGAINEAFLQLPALRPYILNNAPIVGFIHMTAMLLFILLILHYLKKYKEGLTTKDS